METIKVKELCIEVETEIHDKGKALLNIKIPKGWRLLRSEEIIFLHNNEEYKKKLNMGHTWEFIEQPFNLNKEKGYVARFDASPGCVSLYYDRNPSSMLSSLGIRFCKDLE